MSWLLNVLGLLASWHFTELSSDSLFQSVLCPILIGYFLIALLFKLVFSLGLGSRGEGGDGGGFWDDSGDGGCGD